MDIEVKQALMIAVLGAMGTLAMFLWGLLDFKNKVKKLDKIEQIENSLLNVAGKLSSCVDSLHEIIRRQDVNEAVSKQEFKRMAQDIAEIKLRLHRLETREFNSEV